MPPARRISRKKTEAVREEIRRRGGTITPAAPKRGPRNLRKQRARGIQSETTRTIVLTLSPHAANVLRCILARSSHDVQELRAIQKELEDRTVTAAAKRKGLSNGRRANKVRPA